MGEDENVVRVVFMGTPRFAVPGLQALLAPLPAPAPPLRVVCVVTQPDRPAGRGGRLTTSPIKETALAAGLPVWQPERLRRRDNVAALAELRPDLIVVAAFAQILPQSVLDLPRFGCLNVHASLLPRWRGADPIRAAILAGDDRTGITIMQMDAGLDTGPILAQRAVPIGLSDTGGTLERTLADLGGALLAATLPAWLEGSLTPRRQDDAQMTLTRPLRRDDGTLDWRSPAAVLARQVRAYQPWPGTATTWNGRLLKVLEAQAIEGAAGEPGVVTTAPDARAAALRAGLVGPVVLVGSGAGLLAITRLQLAGSRALSAAEFLAGYGRDLQGAILGAAA